MLPQYCNKPTKTLFGAQLELGGPYATSVTPWTDKTEKEWGNRMQRGAVIQFSSHNKQDYDQGLQSLCSQHQENHAKTPTTKKLSVLLFGTSIGNINNGEYTLLPFSLCLFLFIDLKKDFLQDSHLFEYSLHKEHAQVSVALIHLQNFDSYARNPRSLKLSAPTTATGSNHGNGK